MNPLDIVPIFFPQEDSLQDKIEPEIKADTSETFTVNGYQIRWNGYWSEWQVSHPEIGGCESYKDKGEAIEYACNKGVVVD